MRSSSGRLSKELDSIAATPSIKKRNEELTAFQKKLGSLKFLDPACGSGNFLTASDAAKCRGRCYFGGRPSILTRSKIRTGRVLTAR